MKINFRLLFWMLAVPTTIFCRETPQEEGGLRIWAFIPNTPVARADWRPDPLKSEQRRVLKIQVFLTNSGNRNLRIPTAKWSFSFATGSTAESKSTLSIAMHFREPKLFGIQSIPAESSYAPVELKPGETTIVEVLTEVPLAVDSEQMTIRYIVTPYLMERLSFWSGNIASSISHEEPQ